jgi:aryl-alcohol dehydrogenase-like predicted oxidoreductase
LKRLGIDRIDLYQAHKDDPETPFEETLGAFAELITQGKVRAIGASNYEAARLEKALQVSADNALPRYETLQPHYNLYERAGFEKELEPLCLEHGIGVISYFSLARGFLTGKYRSEADLGKSPRGSGASQYLNERGMRILRALDEVSEELRSTPARVALAWLMARPSITAPIASATSLAQLEDLIEAARLSLGKGAIARLDEASVQP